MLPAKVKELTDGFVRAYDSERSPSQAVRDAHTRSAEQVIGNGFGPCGFMVGVFVKKITPYLEERAAFVRDRLKESVVAVGVKPHPDIATELKAQFESYMTPAINAAVQGFDNVKIAGQSPSANSDQARTEFSKCIPRIKAELDLFCAHYATEMDNKTMGTVTYILNGPNARVVIGSQDYSINVANSEHIFSQIIEKINETIKDDAKRAELIARTSEMQQSLGKSTFKEAYNKWASVAADHAQLITFAPFLAELLHKLGLV